MHPFSICQFHDAIHWRLVLACRIKSSSIFNIQCAKVINGSGNVQIGLVGQNVLQQRRFARTRKSSDNRHVTDKQRSGGDEKIRTFSACKKRSTRFASMSLLLLSLSTAFSFADTADDNGRVSFECN
jgi:hypothetical protein